MTRRLVLKTLAGIVLFLAAGGTPVVETIEAASDHSRARDADTIVVAGLPVCLKGVAAPEEGDPLHQPGAEHLGRLLRASKRVRCDLTAERTYDRRVGRCSFDGEDIQRALIADGYALPCLRYGGLRYVPAWVMAPRRGLRCRATADPRLDQTRCVDTTVARTPSVNRPPSFALFVDFHRELGDVMDEERVDQTQRVLAPDGSMFFWSLTPAALLRLSPRGRVRQRSRQRHLPKTPSIPT